MGNIIISGYRIDSKLDSGAFGTVLKGTCIGNGQSVAIKMPNPSIVGSDDKIEKEVMIQRNLSHPNVVKCCDSILYNNAVCLVMEYCNGGTLNSLLLGQLPDQLTLLQLFLQVIIGVEYLHSHNIVHLDIKPDNIMISIGSQGITVKIVDFGLCRDIGNSSPQLEFPPYYSAPELLNGPVSEKADIFSLGCVILAMFSRTTVQWIDGKPMLAPYIQLIGDNTFYPLSRVYDFRKWISIQQVVKLPYYRGNDELLEDLVFNMVQYDSSKRLSATRCKELMMAVILNHVQPLTPGPLPVPAQQPIPLVQFVQPGCC